MGTARTILVVATRVSTPWPHDSVHRVAAVSKRQGVDAHVLLLGGAVVHLLAGFETDLLPVFYVAEDLAERGLSQPEAAAPVARGELPAFFKRYDQVWWL